MPALDQLRTLAAADEDDDPDAELPTMAFAGSVARPTGDRTVILPGTSPSAAPPARTPSGPNGTFIEPGGPNGTFIQPGGPNGTVIQPGGPAQPAAPPTADRTVLLAGAASVRPFADLGDLPVDRTVRLPPSGQPRAPQSADSRPWMAGAPVDRAVRQPGMTVDRVVRVSGAPPPAERTVVLRGPDADDEPPGGATVVDPRSPRRAARDDQTVLVPRDAPTARETMVIAAGNDQETMLLAARPPKPVPEARWPLKKTLIAVNVAAVLLLMLALLSL